MCLRRGIKPKPVSRASKWIYSHGLSAPDKCCPGVWDTSNSDFRNYKCLAFLDQTDHVNQRILTKIEECVSPTIPS